MSSATKLPNLAPGGRIKPTNFNQTFADWKAGLSSPKTTKHVGRYLYKRCYIAFFFFRGSSATFHCIYYPDLFCINAGNKTNIFVLPNFGSLRLRLFWGFCTWPWGLHLFCALHALRRQIHSLLIQTKFAPVWLHFGPVCSVSTNVYFFCFSLRFKKAALNLAQKQIIE